MRLRIMYKDDNNVVLYNVMGMGYSSLSEKTTIVAASPHEYRWTEDFHNLVCHKLYYDGQCTVSYTKQRGWVIEDDTTFI